jgi:hypothetical protein
MAARAADGLRPNACVGVKPRIQVQDFTRRPATRRNFPADLVWSKN